jgi:hypothetical protein
MLLALSSGSAYSAIAPQNVLAVLDWEPPTRMRTGPARSLCWLFMLLKLEYVEGI